VNYGNFIGNCKVPVLGSGPTHNNAVKGKDEQLLQGQKCEVYPRKAEGE